MSAPMPEVPARTQDEATSTCKLGHVSCGGGGGADAGWQEVSPVHGGKLGVVDLELPLAASVTVTAPEADARRG